MRTGDREPAAARYRSRGFTYLFVLFFVAITAAALAALGQSWHAGAQRERECELEFRAGAIARAIQAYRRATPGLEQNPPELAALIEDRRGLVVRHHLRQIYTDPFTGQPDWQLLPDPADPRRFIGVRSRSSQELLRSDIGPCKAVRLASDCAFRALDYARGTPFSPPQAASSP
ncbi:MAG: type II secretion system protein [Paucibacter sp.]|nr:type II secretion system protein [Roseateles sp.]